MSVAAPSAAPIAESLTGRRLPSERVAEMQRAKILAATLSALDEGGFAAATVARDALSPAAELLGSIAPSPKSAASERT